MLDWRVEDSTQAALNSRNLAPQRFQTIHYFRLLLGFAQRLQMLANVAPIKSAFSLPDYNSPHVLPVNGAIGERLHDNQVFRRAQTNHRLRLDFNHDCPADCRLLEWQRAQGYIDAHAGRVPEKQHPILQGKTSCIWTSACVVLQKSIHECLFRAKTCEQGEVDIHCHSWLSPMLHGKATDHTKWPTTPGAKLPQLDSNARKLVQAFLNLANHLCCVTRPDQGSGG